MSSWQPNPPPAGFYPGQQGYGQPPYPKQEGYPPQAGYPQQPGYPAQPGYPSTYPTPPPPYESPNPTFAPPPAGFTTPPQAGMYGSSYGDEPLTQNPEAFEFTEKSIRQGFIRKVYSILMMQLLISLSFITLFTYHEGTKKFIRVHPELMVISFVVMLVTLISMACCTSVRRKAPMNFIFLFLFTIAESFMLGVTASRYNTETVLMAVGICAAVCLGLTLFAFQTKWDFTMMGGALCVAVIILMLFGLVAMFFPNKTLIMVYASAGALIFCLYLVYDTQLMLGGKHKYSISPEEYIFAALNLYLDIVNIFVYLLTIIGLARD